MSNLKIQYPRYSIVFVVTSEPGSVSSWKNTISYNLLTVPTVVPTSRIIDWFIEENLSIDIQLRKNVGIK